ncbi:DJ-1/PfpI family protein [Isoptericola sp. BMS4]|uniref:DJ-1/PfpI family protein n=1 Tax=Isoptericola sp. BMS4 TaxID=2527875 RepID=UPI0014206136|nr:DJ-1/PfpI family protein [Isoptericola sp. BMS4]
MTDLTGKRVLVIVTGYGVEQDELVVPLEHLRAAGATVTVASDGPGDVRTLVGDKDPGRTVPVDTTYDEADTAAADLLLVPGGTLNADSLRLQAAAIRIVDEFAAGARPVAAICHGPWALVEAGRVAGATLTSYPSLATDVRNAGGTWVDRAVVRDSGAGFPLVTSRTPDDLHDFLREVEAALVG